MTLVYRRECALHVLQALGQLRCSPPVLLGFLQAPLQARDMTLERLDGRLGHLGATQKGVLAGLRGPARTPLGEQVTLTRGLRGASSRDGRL